jgi:hypothetical protein
MVNAYVVVFTDRFATTNITTAATIKTAAIERSPTLTCRVEVELSGEAVPTDVCVDEAPGKLIADSAVGVKV